VLAELVGVTIVQGEFLSFAARIAPLFTASNPSAYHSQLAKKSTESSDLNSSRLPMPSSPAFLTHSKRLRKSILAALAKQGFRTKGKVVEYPRNLTKDSVREMHTIAVAHRRENAKAYLQRHESRLLGYIANGEELDPSQVQPKLVLVKPDTEQELLFRYVSLHWSIPVSSGYGRRLRFLVFDHQNGKLIGLLGLGDPVYSLRARDEMIGWDADTKRRNLYHVMDAFVLGAVPPYSRLLCGKLIAMLALSNEVRRCFRTKYKGSVTLIRGQRHSTGLVLLTTTSALGRSSIYNRLRLDGTDYWSSIGFTQGSGEFHFSNGVYGDIREFVEVYCNPTAKTAAWGDGFRNKREVIKKCLSSLGLPPDLLYHGIQRQIFLAPLARNGIAFLKGEEQRIRFYDRPATILSDAFLARWLQPRAARTQDYKDFDRESYRLW